MFKKEITDERGVIKVIGSNDTLEVISKAGSKRAQHYHRTSSHLCYLVYGEIEYYERNVGEKIRPTKLLIKPNQYFYTGPMVEHLMKFTKDSSFMCFSFGSREQKDYENDLVRLDFDLEDEYNNWKYELSYDCRLCGETNVKEVFKLNSPLANNLVSKDEKAEVFPLTVIQCATCGAVQLKEIVNPKLLFSNYLYSSSQSGSLKSYFEKYAKEVLDYCKPKGLIVEVGGNDGVLALPIKNLGYDVLNIEPAENLAKVSESKGIKTLNEFFDRETTIDEKVGLIISNNCFAHIPSLHDFLSGVVKILDTNGWFVFENAYCLDTVQNLYFDQFYSEHQFYHLVSPMFGLLSSYGLEIKNIERNNQQGGSIRVYCQKTGEKYNTPNEIVSKYIETEKEAGLYNGAFQMMGEKLEKVKNELVTLLQKLKAEGKKIVGYGYPAKATTFLSFFNIAPFLDYVVEDSELKVGKFTPVGNLPIVNKEHFQNNPPDVCLILAWNYAELIKKNNPQFKNWLVALPEVKLDE